MERTTAIFHASDRMDEAVRELEEQVGPERVHTEADPPPRVEPRPHALFGMPFSVHYAGAGAGLGMITGLVVSGAPGGASTMTTIWLVIVCAGLGALIGTFVGVAVGGLRKLRWEARVIPHRFLLRVEVETPAEQEAVRRTIASYGGELTSA